MYTRIHKKIKQLDFISTGRICFILKKKKKKKPSVIVFLFVCCKWHEWHELYSGWNVSQKSRLSTFLGIEVTGLVCFRYSEEKVAGACLGALIPEKIPLISHKTK